MYFHFPNNKILGNTFIYFFCSTTITEAVTIKSFVLNTKVLARSKNDNINLISHINH